MTQKLGACIGASIDDKGDSAGTPQDNAVEADADPEMERARIYQERVVAHVIDLKPTRPEMIRGIPLWKVLHLLPWLWIRGYSCNSWYALSHVVTQLDEFWSHSWQAAAWQQYLNILILGNGFAALLVSNLSAVLAYALVMVEILPTDEATDGSKWCSCAGILSYYVILLGYRHWKMIFLDIACINQKDSEQKIGGVLSMGAILKCSKRLIVLWDPTYACRLWCVWELSAFLHACGRDTRKLTAVPPLWGPVVAMGHVSFSVASLVLLYSGHAGDGSGRILVLIFVVPCFTAVVHTLRLFCRNLDKLEQQLGQFTMSDAHSSCCQQRFCGKGVACDREIISGCISHWFGSTQNFEHYVQSEMCPALVHKLANQAFSYLVFLQICSPVCWHFMDRSAGNRRWDQLGAVLTWWVCGLPITCALTFRLSYLLRSRYWRFIDISISSAVVISVTLPILGASLANEQVRTLYRDLHWDMPDATFGVASLVLTLLISSCVPPVRR